MTGIDISIVIPVRNECGNVNPLMVEIACVMRKLGWSFEVIWIDDASDDTSPLELGHIHIEYPEAAVITLAKRSGQSAALWSGLLSTKGEFIVTMDGDGQNDPHDIPRLLQELSACDLVVGHRLKRKAPLGKRLFSYYANFGRNLITGSRIPDSGCALRAFRREIVNDLIPFRGLHRFLPTIAENAGRRVRIVEVNDRPRTRGKSKYRVLDRAIVSLLDCAMLRWMKWRKIP